MPLIPISYDATIGGGSLGEIQAEDLQAIYNRACYVYSTDTNVTLSVVGSGGNLGLMTDTRYQAGASTSQTSAEGGFASEAATENISLVTTNYTTIEQTVTQAAANTLPDDSNGLVYPLMTMEGTNNLQAMDVNFFFDIFIQPALAQLVAGGVGPNRGGAYFISNATSLTGATRVSATPVFIDTRANAAAYTSGGIPEAQDQPTTIANFYLYKNTPSAPSYPSTALPVYWDESLNGGNGGIKIYSAAQFDALLLANMKYHATNAGDVPSRIRYSINGAGTTMGSSMTNTVLSGSSAAGYTTRFVSISDYRTQEFPNGTPVTSQFFNLRAELY